MKKVFITKFALTIGIIESEMDIRIYGNSELACGKINDGDFSEHVFTKKDFFYDKDEAIKQCNKLRDNKIRNLEKQVEKLKNIIFE